MILVSIAGVTQDSDAWNNKAAILGQLDKSDEAITAFENSYYFHLMEIEIQLFFIHFTIGDFFLLYGVWSGFFVYLYICSKKL